MYICIHIYIYIYIYILCSPPRPQYEYQWAGEASFPATHVADERGTKNMCVYIYIYIYIYTICAYNMYICFAPPSEGESKTFLGPRVKQKTRAAAEVHARAMIGRIMMINIITIILLIIIIIVIIIIVVVIIIIISNSNSNSDRLRWSWAVPRASSNTLARLVCSSYLNYIRILIIVLFVYSLRKIGATRLR